MTEQIEFLGINVKDNQKRKKHEKSCLALNLEDSDDDLHDDSTISKESRHQQGKVAFYKDMYTQEQLEISDRGNYVENFRGSKDDKASRQKRKSKRNQVLGNVAFCKDMYTQEQLEIENGNCYENYRTSKDDQTTRQKMKSNRDQERMNSVYCGGKNTQKQWKTDNQNCTENVRNNKNNKSFRQKKKFKQNQVQENAVYCDINTQEQLGICDNYTENVRRTNDDKSDRQKKKIKKKRLLLICTIAFLVAFVFAGMICLNTWILTNRMSDIQTNSMTKSQDMLQQILKQPNTHILLQKMFGNKKNNDTNSMQSNVFNVGLKNDDHRLQECQGSMVKQSFHDLDYAFFGYNILRGFPLSFGHDPGFTYPIFNSDFSEGLQTSDCRYSLPRGLSIVPDVACSVSFSSTVVHNMFQFSKSLSTSASASGGGWGASFSASSSYKHSSSQMAMGQSIFIITSAYCQYYFSKFLAETPPPFSESFLSWVYKLNNSNTEKEYFAFFDAYGTHFPTYVVFGSRFTYQYKMSSENFKSKSSKGIDVAVQASYSGLFSAGGGFNMDSSQQQEAEEFSKSVETTVITVGAAPPANGDAMTWASTVKDSPVPMKYTLQPIVNLFSKDYMEGLNVDFSAIALNITTFQLEYCNYLKSLHQVHSCADLYPGVMIQDTLTIYKNISNFNLKTFLEEDDCHDNCFDTVGCVVVSYTKDNSICLMFDSTDPFTIENEGITDSAEWVSVVFPGRIDSLIRYLNTTVIGISRASKAVRSISNEVGCHNECIKDAYCVAYTFCQCPDQIDHCQLYDSNSIHKLSVSNYKTTCFISLGNRKIIVKV